MSKHLNPLEKEFLIRQYKSNYRIKMSDFCEANHISTGAFQKWIKQYDEGGLEGLARADSEIKDVLPEGIDRTEESYKREILKLRIENERLKKKLCRADDGYWGTGVHSFKAEEFEIVELLSRDYEVQELCSLMGVSRSGYYKWRKRDKSTRYLRREEVIALVSEVHKAHPSHGYRWVAAFIRVNYQQDISDNYVYKVFRFLGIKAKTKHQVHYRPRKIRDLYPNLIFTTWDTVDRPRQVIVSDMTVLKPWIFYLELTLYFDVFTNQILTWKLSERRGGREQYLDGLADVVELLRGKKEPTIIHTDQGSVYSSKAYNELIQDSNIVRSMSRAGKPTDNPVNEALNGWIKEELFIDFRLEECRTRDAVKDVLCRYVAFYNRQRPCFAIGYDTPDNYCKRFYRGELEKKDTFSKRILTEEPKFVQKRKDTEK